MSEMLKQLGIKPPELLLSRKPDASRFHLVNVDFAVMPGQPTHAFLSTDGDTTIVLCLTPLIGMDPMLPTGLNYPVQVISLQNLTTKDVSCCIADVLDSLDAKHLIEDVKTKALNFRISVERDCVTDMLSDGRQIQTYFAIATIEVSEHLYSQIVNIINAQASSGAFRKELNHKGSVQ